MEPTYFLENRYSFVVDALRRIDEPSYEVESPETHFERQIQRQLAVANKLLTNGKFSAALDKYDHIRGLISATMRPQIGVLNGTLVPHTQIDIAKLVQPMVQVSAEMLQKTPVTESAIPEKFRFSDVSLTGIMAKQFSLAESAGVKDIKSKEVSIGSALDQVNIEVQERRFDMAAKIIGDALKQTDDPELQGALLHDMAVMNERAGKRDAAIEQMKRSVDTFAKAQNADMQTTALTDLAAIQLRGDDRDAAVKTLNNLEQVKKQNNVFTIVADRRPVATNLTLSSGNDFTSRLTANRTNLRFAQPVISASTITPVTATTTRITDDSVSKAVIDEIKAQPVQLLATKAFAQRKTSKQMTIIDSEQNTHRIRLDTNAVKDLNGFYNTLKTTRDLGLLMGYLWSPTNTIAYLTHVYSWVIPMAIGDCHAALGSYADAEREYLSTLNYPFLNEVVETVNLWLRLADLYLDWGDRLYRQARNDVSEYGKAREKYEAIIRLDNTIDDASPMYKNTRFGAIKKRATKAIQDVIVKNKDNTENPRVLMALLRARMQIFKIDNQLNFIGLGVHIPPFSFEYLQNVARYFTQHASQVEQMYIQFQSTGENEKLREQQMAQQASIAAASVELERRGLDEAQEGVDVAQANLNAANVQHQNAVQAANDFAAVRWELLELDAIQAWSSAAAVDEDDEVRQTITGFTYYSATKKDRSDVLFDLAKQRTRITHNLEANRLQREINAANAYRQVGQQQVQQAQARVEIANQRIAIAQMQERYARENLQFLKGREFDSAMWYNLAREARRLSGRYLDMAIEVATLMEKAYEAETGRDLRKIKFEYGLNHLNGLLGAEALLLDVDYFSLDYVRTKAKKAQMKQTISLADHFPMAFERLVQTGRTFFETTLEHFDRRYPGFYLQKVKQAEVVFVGLGGSEGVHGTLRNLGLSQFRTKSGAIVNQTYPADVMPLSEYNVRQDAIVFQLDSKELRLFENNGVATMWQLDLPLATNTFDLRQILDIQLVISYDGFFNAGLEQQILANLPANGSASRGISLRMYAPDEWFYLRSNGSAELQITPSLFPANHINQQLSSYFIQARGDNVAGLKLRVDLAGLGISHTFELDANGNADGTAFPAPINQSLFDTWKFTINPADNPGFDPAGLTDLAVFIEYDFDYKS